MDHKNFIAGLSRQTGKSIPETETIVENLTKLIKDNLCNLDAVAIPGVGRFNPVKTDEHISEDDEGRSMLYPPHVGVEFVAGSQLKNRFKNI